MAEVSRECGLEVVVDDYVETFKPFLMDIMYSWSKGASFRDICLMTGEEEGERKRWDMSKEGRLPRPQGGGFTQGQVSRDRRGGEGWPASWLALT